MATLAGFFSNKKHSSLIVVDIWAHAMRVFPQFFLIDWSTVVSIELQMLILQTLTVGLLKNLDSAR